MNKWFNENYERLKIICRNITKETDVDELLHFCIDQILKNKNFISIENDEEKIYFFSRVIKNNFSSIKSPYHRTYRRNASVELCGDPQIIDEPYEEDGIDMDWVKQQIEIMKKSKDWYYGRLFDLYIEENCNLTNLSKRTTIPLNSVSRDIKKVREHLIKLRKQKLYGV